MHRRYNPTDAFIYKNIDLGSNKRIVFLSGLGIDIRQQREGFARRFALNSGVSYLALDYTKYLESDPQNMEKAFSKTMEVLSNLPSNEKLFLSGPCFGGLMALKAASKMPERVGGVVTISAAYETADFPWIDKADQFLTGRINRLKEKSVNGEMTRKMVLFRQLVITAFNQHSREKIEPTYQGPLALFHGQKDHLIPVENSARIQADLNNPNASLYVIPNTGHTLNSDFEMRAQIQVFKKQLEHI